MLEVSSTSLFNLANDLISSLLYSLFPSIYFSKLITTFPSVFGLLISKLKLSASIFNSDSPLFNVPSSFPLPSFTTIVPSSPRTFATSFESTVILLVLTLASETFPSFFVNLALFSFKFILSVNSARPTLILYDSVKVVFNFSFLFKFVYKYPFPICSGA